MSRHGDNGCVGLGVDVVARTAAAAAVLRGAAEFGLGGRRRSLRALARRTLCQSRLLVRAAHVARSTLTRRDDQIAYRDSLPPVALGSDWRALIQPLPRHALVEEVATLLGEQRLYLLVDGALVEARARTSTFADQRSASRDAATAAAMMTPTSTTHQQATSTRDEQTLSAALAQRDDAVLLACAVFARRRRRLDLTFARRPLLTSSTRVQDEGVYEVCALVRLSLSCDIDDADGE